jgi:RNA polymerase sigma-B factor
MKAAAAASKDGTSEDPERHRAEDIRRNGGPPSDASRAEIRKFEEELLRRYAASPSPELLDRIVKRFLPLARSLAMRYNGGTEPLEDLVQVADLGLVKAVEGFDPERGRPFTAYAVPTILGELRRHFRDRVWNMHLPRSLQERTMEVDGAVAKLTEELGRTPSVSEIGEAIDAPDDEVLEAMQADQARRTISLDAPKLRDEGDSAPTVESIGSEDLGYDRVEAELAAEASDLDEREQLVLQLRFAKGMTQYEIGQQLGVSQMQISRISRRALAKLLSAVQGDE